MLISDGNPTLGDAMKAAASMRGKVEVLATPLPGRTEPEVQLSSVSAPAQVLQGEPFQVEVLVDSNHADDAGRIEVYRGDIKVADQPVKLKAGENRIVLKQTIDAGGLTPVTARLRGYQDTLLDNNSDFALVSAAGKPRVLLLESEPDQAKHLTWALEEQNIQVDVRPPRGAPENLAELQNYDLLVLSNVPATSLTLRQMEVARTYVRDLGGGLIMLGGDQSFGLGGYYKSTLEEILPVRSDFEKEKEKPSLAMMLVIDKSGSMGGEKIEMAKEAARAAVELLGPSDKVGVLAFEGENFWISELHPCTDKGFVLDRIAGLEAGGGTNMAPAMEEAYETLKTAVAKLKHVIILTDGISQPGDFEGIAQAMNGDRITVSTVAMGSDADQNLLEEIARTGNGRFYLADDPAQVPQIFAKETVTASKSAINEQPFSPAVVRPTQVLSELKLDEAPFLLGYVITRPKPTSEVILATEAGDPLLAWWRYGLGMSVAFTSDAKARWAAEWLTWPQFGQFWAQVVRHALRKSEARGSLVLVERKGRKAVRLDRRHRAALGKVPEQGVHRADAGGSRALDAQDPDAAGRARPIPGGGRHGASGHLPAHVQPDQGHATGRAPDARAGRRLPGRAAAAADQYGPVEGDRRHDRRPVRGPARVGVRRPGAHGAPGRAALALPGDRRFVPVRARRGLAPGRFDTSGRQEADPASRPDGLIVQLSALNQAGAVIFP